MRETLWLWLRGSALLRKLYEFPLARKPMAGLSYLLVPSRRKRRLRVRKGPGMGLMFEINPRWEMHLWEGDYELAVQQVLVDRLRPGAVFYDVGAGFGFYSSLAARLGAQVFAFEPDEENAKSLRHHAELNALTPRIEIVRLAVLAASGVTHFEPAPQERGHGNGQVSEDPEQAITVHCTSLDDFVGLNPLPNLIKIDVEGAESEVLKGAEELFDRCRPSVICEVHDAANALFVSDWLERKGYSVEYIGNRSEYPAHLVATPQMKVRFSKVVQTAPLRIPAQEGRSVSSRENFSGERSSSRPDCHKLIANEPRRELYRSGSLTRVETAAG